MEEKKYNYHNLLVYQAADRLALEVYKYTKNFPKEELFGLVSQMRRAAISIPANIAEGYMRQGSQEKIRFYNIAQGSLAELESFIELSGKLGFLSKDETKRLLGLKDNTGKLLHGFIKSISVKTDNRKLETVS